MKVREVPSILMIPESKGLNSHELAHGWVKDLGTRPNMRIKVGRKPHDIRMLGRIVEVRSTKQSGGIILINDTRRAWR